MSIRQYVHKIPAQNAYGDFYVGDKRLPLGLVDGASLRAIAERLEVLVEVLETACRQLPQPPIYQIDPRNL